MATLLLRLRRCGFSNVRPNKTPSTYNNKCPQSRRLIGAVQLTKLLPLWTNRWLFSGFFNESFRVLPVIALSRLQHQLAERRSVQWVEKLLQPSSSAALLRDAVSRVSSLLYARSQNENPPQCPGTLYWAATLPGCGGRKIYRTAVWLANVWFSP